MPEMEKGRAAENKRSRKPAHPVKRELNQEMKSFAESTMNELLGWYGYDKVELRESEANEIRNYRERRQHVSVLKENSMPKPKESKGSVPASVLSMKTGDRDSVPGSVLSMKTGDRDSVPGSVLSMKMGDRDSVPVSSPSSSSALSSAKELKSAPVIVPLIKPSAVEDVQSVQIVCVWCQKEGVKRYSLSMGSELKSFCSEKCFAACRRAYFKRNKARDEDLHGERSPQPPHAEDSPRLVLKINSSVRPVSPVPQVCDWCKHVRHTKEYLDFGSGDERLQFCSTKCLNQYKMDVFYREARAALSTSSTSSSSPSHDGQHDGADSKSGAAQKLLTPESWSNGDAKLRKPSPKAAAPGESPTELSSSSKVSRTLERPPPPPLPSALPVSPAPPPPPHPLPPIPMPFIRPPLHAQGLKSPLASAPRHPGPPSSPIHRPPHSPHLQPPTPAAPMNPPGLVHPFPGAYFPGLHSPPVSMLPRGPPPVPLPPMMNFGIPSFGPLLPQPTVLVPYPVIVPLPVPIPIPIPIPLNPNQERSSTHSGVIQPVPDGFDRIRYQVARPDSRDGEDSSGRENAAGSEAWVKSERSFPSPSPSPDSGASSPRSESTDCRHSSERQVIRRVVQRSQVKVEPGAHGALDLGGIGEPAIRAGHALRPSPSPTPPPDTIYHLKDPGSSPTRSSPLLEKETNGTDGSPESPGNTENTSQTVECHPEEPAANVGDVGEDPHVPDEDHAYALPTTPKSSGTGTPTPAAVATPTTPTPTTLTPTAPAPLLLPKLRDKGSLRSPATAPPAGADMEPALKRRCLRLREQSK